MQRPRKLFICISTFISIKRLYSKKISPTKGGRAQNKQKEEDEEMEEVVIAKIAYVYLSLCLPLFFTYMSHTERRL